MRWAPELADERLLLDLVNSTPVTEAGPIDLLTEGDLYVALQSDLLAN